MANMPKKDLESNDCRNPDHDPLGPWCFKNDYEAKIGYCKVDKTCKSQKLACKRTQLGMEYRGHKSTTKSGRLCSSWKHRMTDFDPSISEAENFCRNPDGDSGGPWCYVDDNGEAWESCGIDWCSHFRYSL